MTIQVQFCRHWGRAQKIWALSQAFWETVTHSSTHELQDMQLKERKGNVPKPMPGATMETSITYGAWWSIKEEHLAMESDESTGWVSQSTCPCEEEAGPWPDYCLPFRRDCLGWWPLGRWRNHSIELRKSQLLSWESYLDIFVSSFVLI